MKKIRVVLGFLTVFFSNAAFSESGSSVVSFEILGRGGVYSLNYDYSLFDSLALGVGFSVTTTTVVAPIYANVYLVQWESGRPFLTGGATIAFDSARIGGLTVASSNALGVFGGGYEYRMEEGFVFRGAAYLLVGNKASPWVGVSAGLSF